MSEVHCSHCGRNSTDAEVAGGRCYDCGKRLTAPPIIPPTEQAEYVTEQLPMVTSVTGSAACPRCGTPLATAGANCYRCGVTAEDEGPSLDEAEPSPEDEDLKWQRIRAADAQAEAWGLVRKGLLWIVVGAGLLLSGIALVLLLNLLALTFGEPFGFSFFLWIGVSLKLSGALIVFAGGLLLCAVPEESGVRGWAAFTLFLLLAGGCSALRSDGVSLNEADKFVQVGQLFAWIGTVASIMFAFYLKGVAQFFQRPVLVTFTKSSLLATAIAAIVQMTSLHQINLIFPTPQIVIELLSLVNLLLMALPIVWLLVLTVLVRQAIPTRFRVEEGRPPIRLD